MNIDAATGTIIFPSGRLGRSLTLEQFGREPFADSAELTVNNPPWSTYDVELDERFLASVVFKGQKLAEIRLLMTEPGERDAPWTVDAEKRRKLEHDAWLQSELGRPPLRLPWGTVDSVYDERANCSHIILRYS